MKASLSQTKDININSPIQEEILIKSLIDDIYKAEEKISQINNSKDNSQNGININNQKLFELKALQKNLEQKLILLNNNNQKEINSFKNRILSQKNTLNELEASVKEYQNKLLSFNTNDIKSPLLSKYILENDINNKILSQEQINEIYFKNKNDNENEIKQLVREIEINKASESVIINNKKEINKKFEQINENLKMLKEEKLSINDELINIISYKESLECINKNNIINMIKKKNLKNNINNENSNNLNDDEEKDFEDNISIKIYLYELSIIDPNKAANKIYEELYDYFRIIGFNNNKRNKPNMSLITNDITSTNISKNNTNINFYPNNNDMNTIDILENKKNTNFNIISFNNLNSKNKSLSNSCIATVDENNFINDKNSLKYAIKEEIKSFIKTINNNKINIDNSSLINNFLDKIMMIIIEQFKNYEQNIENNYSNFQNDLILYLTYLFKIIYYDITIENIIKFVNKDYKTQKKEYKKYKDIINNELLKLENKYDEIKSKKFYNESQLSLLNNTNKNKNQENDNYFNLTPNEKSYIQICIKINSIIKKKEEIQININNYEDELNNKKTKNKNEIDNINYDIEKINNEISNINNINELNTLKNNENIIKYRKIIDDKFNAIKEQLKLYKEKYGSNLSLYNKFINNINSTIQKSYNKSFFELDSNKNDISNSYNNGLIINGAENKNNNDKYINLNMIGNFKNKNSLNNNYNIINSKIFSTDRKIEKNSFIKSINYKDNKENIGIDKNVGNILNKTISNLKQSSDFNLLPKELYIGDNKNHNFINNIKIEKKNSSFFQNSSFSSKNIKDRKSNSNKKRNIESFDLFNRNIFNANNFMNNKEKIEEERRKDKNINTKNNETNSKTFSHPFFRKQSKSQGGMPESGPFHNQNKTTKNAILNINLFRHKKNSLNSGIHKGIPRGSKIINNENLKNVQNKQNVQNIKNSIKNIKARIEKNSLINNNNFLNKLNPLTKITFCYYREIPSNQGNFIKYNPLKNITSKELCEYPYNFIKSTISLNKNYQSIKIVPSTQLEPIDIKIAMVENTVVSSAVKTIIDIHRNYYKWKENNKVNNIINGFIDEQIKKYENFSQEDIEKCIVNKNFNFSLIANFEEEEKNNKRIEFIICSYDEFKMWINGMAYIIKNKNSIIKLVNQDIYDN